VIFFLMNNHHLVPRVFYLPEEMEHGEELARRHDHVVAKPTCNNRVMHYRLVRLILEIAIPTRSELGTWPAIHHLELFLSRTDLNTSFNAVGRKWTGTVDVPLLENSLLDCRITTCKVVKRLDMWLRAVRGESEAGNILVLVCGMRIMFTY
jgi:hypothetical protein